MMRLQESRPNRMGQPYASLKTGHVAASVVLKRLVGFSAKNRFYSSTFTSRKRSAGSRNVITWPIPIITYQETTSIPAGGKAL
jgi:hypothetical protein